MLSFRSFKPVCVAAIAIFTLAGAQQKNPAGADMIFLDSKVGSFKIVGGSPTAPPVGRLEVSFTGTLLVSDAVGKVEVSGNLKKEYDHHKKVAYHGTGKVIVDGKFFSAQWFGRDMTASFKGTAIVRVYGEFDKDLNTGKYWYGTDLNAKNDWFTGGQSLLVPQPAAERRVVPRVRSSGG